MPGTSGFPTLTTFATSTDVSLAELHVEALLPADESTAKHLRDCAAAALREPDRADFEGTYRGPGMAVTCQGRPEGHRNSRP
ncbi:hypothetical protein GCM10009838_68120 [Catenulispora subtropica]|uniref:Uncharacterized protein n=1 Tax=Catenulispora subtropica TaxID=450798 RepID=A0ABN2SXP6_9ACTN